MFEIMFDKGFKGMIKAEGELAVKAHNRSVGEALSRGYTALTDKTGGIPSCYNIKKKELKPYIRKGEDKIEVESHLLSIGPSGHFETSPSDYRTYEEVVNSKRPKMYVKTMNSGRKRLKRKFFVNPDKTHGSLILFKVVEKGKGKYKKGRGRRIKDKLQPVKNITVAQMAENKLVYGYVHKEMLSKYNDRMSHNYKHMKQKAVKKAISNLAKK